MSAVNNTREYLISKFRDDLVGYVRSSMEEKEKAVPYITTRLTTAIIPQMMKIVGQQTELSGFEKKQLIEDAVIGLVDLVFKELDDEFFKDVEWDDQLRDIIKFITPSIIDLLVSVDKGKLKINKRRFICC